MSKLIPFIEFPKLPSTDSADVKENIDNWLERGMLDKLKTFTRPDPKGHKGYRFVRSADFETPVNEERVVLGIALTVEFKRCVKSYSSLDPLSFQAYGYGMFVYWNEYQIAYNSDAQLKRVIQGIKECPKISEDNYYVHDFKNGLWITSGGKKPEGNQRRHYSRYTGR